MDAKVMKRAVVVLLCLLARCPANHRMGAQRGHSVDHEYPRCCICCMESHFEVV